MTHTETKCYVSVMGRSSCWTVHLNIQFPVGDNFQCHLLACTQGSRVKTFGAPTSEGFSKTWVRQSD